MVSLSKCPICALWAVSYAFISICIYVLLPIKVICICSSYSPESILWVEVYYSGAKWTIIYNVNTYFVMSYNNDALINRDVDVWGEGIGIRRGERM